MLERRKKKPSSHKTENGGGGEIDGVSKRNQTGGSPEESKGDDRCGGKQFRRFKSTTPVAPNKASKLTVSHVLRSHIAEKSGSESAVIHSRRSDGLTELSSSSTNRRLGSPERGSAKRRRSVSPHPLVEQMTHILND